MNEIEKNNILVEKLSLQINSFQEGFKILFHSKNLSEIGTNFTHILRGNLLVSNVNLFFNDNKNSGWKDIFLSDNNSKDFCKYLKTGDSFNINFENNLTYKIFTTVKCLDNSYFGLIIGEKLDRTEFNSLDKITLQIFSRLLENSYQTYVSRLNEKQLIFSLNHKVLQLSSLVETGIEISKLEKNSQLLELALERAVALTNASKGVMRIIFNNKIVGNLKIPNNIDIDETLNSEDKIETTVHFQGYDYIVTLVDKESRDGNTKFDQTDIILLEAFSRQVYAAVENKELHKEALENETLKRELSVASSIQKKIIPAVLPKIEGYEIAGINISSKEVGGDYYDCLELENGNIALIIADVTGKGIPAALLVSTLSASLQAYLEMNLPLEILSEKLNKIIFQATPPDKYITCFIAILNPSNDEIISINAGHNPSLHFKDNNLIGKIDDGGIAFGMFDMGLPYVSQKTKLVSGERILMFTDGITEAMNEFEEEYSDEKLEKYCINNCSQDADLFLQNLIQDVRSFTKDTPQSDDITALYLIKK